MGYQRKQTNRAFKKALGYGTNTLLKYAVNRSMTRTSTNTATANTTYGEADGIRTLVKYIKIGNTPQPDNNLIKNLITFAGSLSSAAGYTGVNAANSFLDNAQYIGLFNQLGFGSPANAQLYMHSMKQETIWTNFTNVPIVLNIYPCMAVMDMDEADPCSSPQGAMQRDVAVADNAGTATATSDDKLLNQFGQNLFSGYNFKRNWKVLHAFKMVLGPYATRKTNLTIGYNKYINRESVANLTGNGANIGGVTLKTVAFQHGVAGKTDTDAVTLTSTEVGHVTSNVTTYSWSDNNIRRRYFGDSISKAAVTQVGNVDSGVVSGVVKV